MPANFFRMFTVKKIQSQAVGEIFKKTREEIGLELDEVCKTIKVNKKYLKALEEGDYNSLPTGLYARKFFKNYSDYLNLEFEALWTLYEREQAQIFGRPHDSEKFIKTVSPRSLIDVAKIIKICIGGLLVVILLGYLGWEIKKIFLPPDLEVISPVDNLIISKSTVEVTGRTEKETQVSINGQEIPSSSDGFFSESINLQEGLNIIKISSKKRHSRESIVYRRVMVEINN